jgi:hypothetical protein
MNEIDQLKDSIKKCAEQVRNLSTYVAGAMALVKADVERMTKFLDEKKGSTNLEIESMKQKKETKKNG